MPAMQLLHITKAKDRAPPKEWAVLVFLSFGLPAGADARTRQALPARGRLVAQSTQQLPARNEVGELCNVPSHENSQGVWNIVRFGVWVSRSVSRSVSQSVKESVHVHRY